MTRHFSLRHLVYLLSLAALNVHAAVAQEVCGEYETMPGSTVQYMYLPGTPDFETLPVRATFAIACDDYALSATVFTPIIGVDEDGNEIFPTGLTYPLAITADYDPLTGYTGSLQDTQYHFGWEFHDEPGQLASWSGFVSWFGGRYEETAIDNVMLIPVPEPVASSWLLVGLGVISVRPRGSSV